MLDDPLADDPEECAVQRDAVARLPGILAELTPRERLVVRARFGLDPPPRTLREIGLALGVSAERVRQIEQEALGTLRGARLLRAATPRSRARR